MINYRGLQKGGMAHQPLQDHLPGLRVNGLGDITLDKFDTTVSDINAINHLLTQPRWAHTWFTLFIEGAIIETESTQNPVQAGGLTPSELAEFIDNDIPLGQIETDLEELGGIGAVQRNSTTAATRYDAVFFQADGDNVAILNDSTQLGPQLIGLVGESRTDDAVHTFLETNGLNHLEIARLTYTSLLRKGDSVRFRELVPEVDDDHLEAIRPALERIITDMGRTPDWHEDLRPQLS